ncbi:MAG TPA: hypothetical protein VMQ60_03075 [Acidobacteriaceae bacterium]|jgi:lambda repressor-like predicted transcriptional regulator|nr:hypothetical protein [Acidobacteriaceae bacterium]
MKTYTKEDVVAEIEKEISRSSLRAVSRLKGISSSVLSDVRLGNIGISESVALAFGFVREITTDIKFRKAS